MCDATRSEPSTQNLSSHRVRIRSERPMRVRSDLPIVGAELIAVLVYSVTAIRECCRLGARG